MSKELNTMIEKLGFESFVRRIVGNAMLDVANKKVRAEDIALIINKRINDEITEILPPITEKVFAELTKKIGDEFKNKEREL